MTQGWAPDVGVDVLVEHARAGDRQAFSELLRRHDEAMRGLAYRMMGSQSAMEDVLQDAYIKAYKALDSFRREAQFGTWLHSIVSRTCLDAIRKRDRRREVGLQLVAEQPSGEARAEQRLADISVLGAALEQLPPDQRMVLLLVDGEGMSYGEVAAVLDVAPGTVASRLSRARAAIRQHLSSQENDR